MPIVFEDENGQIHSETEDKTEDEKMLGIGLTTVSDQMQASQDLPNDIKPMIKFDSTMNVSPKERCGHHKYANNDSLDSEY